MKFRLELPINKPRAEVWKAFEDPENLKKWQPSLVKLEPLSGTPGQPGAISRLTYSEDGREFALTETLTRRDEPERLDSVYENKFAKNTIRNTFLEQGEKETLWELENEFRFKTLFMRLFGPIMKKNFVIRTQRDMQRFKEIVEGL